MGTRNLTFVQLDSKYKVAQYGQFDGYPSGQGVVIKSFLDRADIDKLKERVRCCNFITTKFDDEFVSRELGGYILSKIYSSNKSIIFLQDSTDFAKDSLFCEWAYVVNLDNETLEVYIGFVQDPLAQTERFYPLQNIKEVKDDRKQIGPSKTYYPIKHLHTFTFQELREMTNETFCATCEIAHSL